MASPSCRVLPLPPGAQRSRAFAVLDKGLVAGAVSRSGGRERAAAWLDDVQVPLRCPGIDHVELGGGRGRHIAATGDGAVALVVRLEDGGLVGSPLATDGYSALQAVAAGDGVVVGGGTREGTDVALQWRDGAPTMLDADGRSALATSVDGGDVGGFLRTRGGPRPVWWREATRVALLTDDDESTGAVSGVDATLTIQVGTVEREIGDDFVPRATLWRGTADHPVDLTPSWAVSSSARACTAGAQVGAVRAAPGDHDRAALWFSDAASYVDLHACVPAPFTASIATAVAVVDDILVIAGTVVELRGGASAAERAVVWRVSR